MRAYISIVSDGHDTIVIYHHFQEPLGFTDARAWMVTRKTLNFWSMKLADVRALLKRDPRYISELLADDDAHPDPSLYPKLDATLTCRKDGHSLMEILRSEGR